MSRSYKKPWIKDNSSTTKTIHRRQLRRIHRQSTRRLASLYEPGEDYLWFQLPLKKQLCDLYDVTDWRYYSAQPAAKRK